MQPAQRSGLDNSDVSAARSKNKLGKRFKINYYIDVMAVPVSDLVAKLLTTRSCSKEEFDVVPIRDVLE